MPSCPPCGGWNATLSRRSQPGIEPGTTRIAAADSTVLLQIGTLSIGGGSWSSPTLVLLRVVNASGKVHVDPWLSTSDGGPSSVDSYYHRSRGGSLSIPSCTLFSIRVSGDSRRGIVSRLGGIVRVIDLHRLLLSSSARSTGGRRFDWSHQGPIHDPTPFRAFRPSPRRRLRSPARRRRCRPASSRGSRD